MFAKLTDYTIRFPLACAGAMLLVFVILVRPQEFVLLLEPFPVLNIVFFTAAATCLLDLALGKIQTLWSPQLPFLLPLLAWTYIVSIKAGGLDAVNGVTFDVLFSALFMGIVMLGARSLDRFRAIGTLILLLGLGLAAVGVDQAQNDFECVLLDVDEDGIIDIGSGTPDGRPCQGVNDCTNDVFHAQGEYECEKRGRFQTFSIGRGRVRWRGKLGDPNELALFISSALAFGFAMHSEMKKKVRHLLLLGAAFLVAWCVVCTGSRGGQLVFLTVVGLYFIKRYGARGFIMGAAGALPVLLFGGRSGAEAESSSEERLGLLYDGMDLIRESPIFGVGQNQFADHVYPSLTAHNAYVLACAELGFPGLFLWFGLCYVSAKIPVMMLYRPPPTLDPRFRTWATAFLFSLLAMYVGIFFLSFTFHPLLFIYFGLAGALYGAAKSADPYFDIRIGKWEMAFIVGGSTMLMIAVFIYTRLKA